jgi:hypothetical protein
MIQAEKGHIPFVEMECMMGVLSNPAEKRGCHREPLLQADWTVWADGKIAAQGSVPDRCACEFTDKYLFKFIGNFVADPEKEYVVEVKFIKDGTPLNVADPHLIIISEKNH